MTRHTVATLIETVCERFSAADLSYGHGTDNAWDEAVYLVLQVTGLDDDQSSLAIPISEEAAERCLTLAQARISARQPLAYLLGRCRYMGFEFAIRPGVVVPRSPIGPLLEGGLSAWLPDTVGSVLDLCSGSGCLGIVAGHLFPDAEITLVELDPLALDLAAENVAAHGLQQRTHLVRGDVTEGLQLPRRYDLIISNPPYVDARDMATLPPEYAAEPAAGLAAGDDGLQIIDAILARLPEWLASGGLFVGEVGASAPALLAKYPRLPMIWPDLPAGGEGVFILEAQALASHTAARPQPR